MDHILRTQNPPSPFQPVLYYGRNSQRYAGPFDAFGNHLSALLKSNKCNRNTTSGLAQEWLFFGLLEEFFAIFETPFNRDDFLREDAGTPTASTEALKDYLVALIVQEHMRRQTQAFKTKGMKELDPDDMVMAQESMMHLNQAAQLGLNDEAKRLLGWLKRAHTLLNSTKGALEQVSALDIDPAVWDSILVTTSALSRLVDVFLRPLARSHEEVHYPVDFRDFHLRSIADFRQSGEWCPNERKVLEQFTNSQPEEVAFLSQLGGLDGKQHTQCTALECVAHHVDGTYVTAHDTTNCAPEACSMVDYIAAEEDESQNRDSSLPGATHNSEKGSSFFDVKAMTAGLYQSIEHMVDEWTKEVDALTFVDGQIQSVKVPLTKSKMSGSIGVSMKGWNLVAFSHVWSDGLGNRESNSLPACQLRRLQSLANGLYSPRSHPVPFWIDTLMIPIVRSGLSEQEKQTPDLRKKAALRNMEWVYKGASKVLVLDSTLFCVETAQMSPEERGARIMTSVWSRRLWTLQEGCLKDKTFFQFRDDTVSWPILHEEVLQAASISDWRKKRSVLPKGHPIRKLQKIPYFQYNGSRTNYRGTEVDFSMPMHQAKQRLDKLLFRVINPLWCVVRSFLEDMSLDWSGGELHGEALRRCMRSMYYRNCTRKTDEGLVLASLLSAKPGAAANLFLKTSQKTGTGNETTSEKQSQTKPEDRLRELFLELDIVPVDILFANHPRYADKHCRWIPTSLLSVHAPEAHLLRRSERMHRKTTLVRRKANTVCRVTPKGLEIGLDGFRIHPQPTALKAPFRFKHLDVHFSVELREAGLGTAITAREAADWVLIPEAVFASAPRQCKGVLVKVTEWYPRRPGAETEFSCLAVITRMSEEDAVALPLPVYDVKLFEKTKMSFKEAWKDAKNLGKSVMAEAVHGDDKWVVG